MKALAAGVALHLVIVAAHAATIAGTIAGARGEAVGGASVVAYRPEAQDDMLDRVMRGGKRPALAKAISDARGAFALEVPTHGLVIVGVEAAGFAPLFRETEDNETGVTIALTPAPMRSGHTVAGARVIAGGIYGEIDVRSGADGTYSLPDPRLWSQSILVLHPDYAPGIGDASLDVELAHGQTISGKVVDAKGKGIPGARIRLDHFLRATSADDGTFTIAHALLPAMAITAETEDQYGIAKPAPNVTIQVKPALSLAGVVRDEQRNPIAGIMLATASENVRMTVTDEKGAYAFRGLAAGRLSVVLVSRSYSTDDDTLIDLTKSTRHDLTVTHLPALTGTVRTEDGSPVAGAVVGATILFDEPRIYRMDAATAAFAINDRSDAAGRFRLRVPDIEVPMIVTAIRAGLPPAVSDVITMKTGARRPSVVLTVPKGVEVSGSVRDAAGRPLPGVAIAPIVRESVLGAAAVAEWAKSDDDGRFSVRVPSGDWGLHFSKEGFLEERIPHAASAALKVTMQPALEIRGRITRKDGTPVADASVMIEGERPAFAQTQSDGTFVLTGVAKGAAKLRYLIGGGTSGTVAVTAPAKDVNIVLPEHGTIRGRVVDAAGAPVQSFSVTTEPLQHDFENFSMPRAVTDDDGKFDITDAPLGAVNVNVVVSGFLRATRDVLVEAGKSVDAGTIIMNRGHSVRGVVSTKAGEPLEGVDVAVSHSDDSLAEPAKSTDNGSFEITGVSAGETTLSFAKSGFVRLERRVAAGDGDQTLNVQLVAGRVITGRVLSADGKPVAQAEVTARSAAFGAEYDQQKSDANGAFRFDSLLAARYDFNATERATQLSGAVKDVDVSATHEITIHLQPPTRAAIAGQVTGLDAPLFAQVQASTADNDRSASATIDPSGAYRIENVPTGTVTVSAMAGGRRGMRRTAPVTVDVTEGAQMRVDLAFPAQVEVHGRVTRRGEPFAGANIRFSSEVTGDGADVTSAQGGTFDTVLAPGSYSVTVNGYETTRNVRAGSEIDIDINPVSVAVTVVDSADATPVAGAKVSTQDTPSPTHTTDRGMTDGSGQIAFETNAPPARIFVEKSGYATASVDGGTSPVVVKLARSEGAVVRLIDARDGRTLSGYVIARDAAGHVLASASDAGPDGSVRLAVAPGTYRFSASASEYGSHTVTADVPATEVRIPLRRGGKLLLRSETDLHASARLIQPDGEEYVRCWCSGIAEIRITGRATVVDSISPGAYTLEVTPDGGKARTYPVSVIEGQTLTVVLQ